MLNIEEKRCPCGSSLMYQDCCELLLEKGQLASTAEQLMRSRYTAYVLAKAKYIIDTTHPRVRHMHSKKSILQWAKENEWTGLEIVKSDDFTVEFKAFFKDIHQQEHCHYEYSVFEKLGDKLYYLSGSYKE